MVDQVQDTLLKQLKNPFDPKFVKFRLGATNVDKTKGIALAYVDSREVMKRLDDVCGVGGWQDKYIPVDGGFICEISILINNVWVTKSNAAGNTKLEAIKGGASDAFKRAASVWGVGRYLYYLPNAWVAIRQQGNSYVLDEIPELPEWAQPDYKIERWEDVAELQSDMVGADTPDVDAIVSSVDRIRGAKSAEELDKLVGGLDPSDKVVLANQIAAKRRELLHEADITADSSRRATAK